MTYSVERQLVNGVWETRVVDESGGGGGSLPAWFQSGAAVFLLVAEPAA